MPSIGRSGRRHRRTWVGDSKAHIEVKTATRPGSEGLAHEVEAVLSKLDGVDWARVDAVVGRVLVAFDDGSVDVDDLLDAVTGVEDDFGVDRERFSFDRLDHPGDPEPARRAAAALAADVLGIGAGVVGLALRAAAVPVEVASLISLIESEPRLRRLAHNLLGPTLADLVLASANAAAQGLGQGPLGLLVDGAHRANLLAEARKRRAAWERVEPRLFPDRPGDLESRSTAGPAASDAPLASRPVPLPGGPVERYADRAAIASLLGAGAALLSTLDARRASAVLVAGIPKAARMGREAFAAQLCRTLAERDITVLDHDVLRRLDRVDCVCVDASLVLTGEFEIDRIELVGTEDRVEAHRRLRALFDRSAPRKVRRRGRWSIGPIGELDVEQDLAVRRAARQLGGEVYGLAHGDRVAALFTVVSELAPGTDALLDAAHAAGHMIAVAGDELAVVDRLGAHLLVPGGESLGDSVRMLQADECCVALVSRPDTAQRAADCGIAVVDGPTSPWGSDVVVLDGLASAALVVEATAVAYEVSRQSVALALAGTSVGSILAVSSMVSPGSRASTSISLAAMLAQANGMRAAISFARRPRPEYRAAPAWHELDVDEVLERLGTSRGGLTDDVTAQRRGPVRQALSAPAHFAQALGSELANPLTPVLVGGAAASAAVGSAVDSAVIGAVTGVNALLGAGQRFRAEHAVARLERSSAAMVRARQDGAVEQVPADRLAPGSVVLLEAGEVVPADARIIEADQVEIDESSLTGESLPVVKSSAPSIGTVLAERTSMLYEGSTVAAGSATAVVVATGEDTEAMAGIRFQAEAPANGVGTRLAQLSRMTLPFAALGGAGVVASGVVRGQPVSRTLGAGVSLAVAAVPEGLSVLSTLAQLSSARRLSQRHALARNAGAIEALGRVEVLCTDKTGTLTEGRIEVHSVSDGRATVGVAELEGHHLRVLAAALRASPEAIPDRPLAHPTDQAVVTGAQRAGVEPSLGAAGWRREGDLPFEPSRGCHTTLGRVRGGRRLCVKGAPEVVLPRCTTRRRAGDDRPRRLDQRGRRQLESVVDELARRGLRVLAVAEGEPSSDVLVQGDDSELTFLGFVALADPIRPSAKAAVDGLARAGVETVMVTGDHPSTAEGIAAELGILDGRMMTGADLERLDDDELADTVGEVTVFARVSPRDKVRIVRAYQQSGRAVAMTGDGANDAAAIRLADAGLALGSQGTPAARNAADVVITDDRIETVVDAIIEGRAMWGSVRDALAILLGGNLGEIGFTVAATALTGRTPMTSRQILLVNLLTDVAPALAIAARPPVGRSYEDLMAEGPDRSLGASLERAIVWRAVTTAAGAGAAWGLASVTGGPKRARTVGLVALVGTQLGQTITAGGTHPTVLLAGLGSAAVLAGCVQTPVVSQFFGCTPLDPLGWAIALGSATSATGLSWAVPRVAGVLTRP